MESIREGQRPQFNSIHYERPIHRDSDLEVRRCDGALEVDNKYEGIEVQSPTSWGPRPSDPLSISTELPIPESPGPKEGEVVNKRRICPAFLARRGKVVLATVLILVIVVIVGAVTGSLLSRKPPQSQPLSSNLAAVNWTTPSNVTVYVVFSQDTDGSLIAHRKEAGGWDTVNITRTFQDEEFNLGIRPSTPLAAAAISDPIRSTDTSVNQLSLFYLTPSGNITQIVTYTDTLREWNWGDIGPHSDVKLSAAPGSQLSAAWQRCRNATAGCGRTLTLTFEDEQQNYLVANSTYNWTATIAGRRLAINSSMALISMDYGNTSDYLWGFYSISGVMGSAWQDFEGGTWWWTALGRNIMQSIPSSVLQGFAATSFRGRSCAFVAALFPDGSVTAKYWDPEINKGDPEGNKWQPEAKLRPVNESVEINFSSIAMTADARFYGIKNETIQEFRMDQKNPYSFHYVGKVA